MYNHREANKTVFQSDLNLAYEKALSRLNFDDATRLFLEQAELGDQEILPVAYERVKLVTGNTPKNIEEAYHFLART